MISFRRNSVMDRSFMWQSLRRNPLEYGSLFAFLPLLLGIVVGPLIGFGPCGPNVRSSTRLLVIVAGVVSMVSPFVSAWLFWLSFRERKKASTVVGAPLLGLCCFICLYWLIVLISAVMT
jgi:hypothetical protein